MNMRECGLVSILLRPARTALLAAGLLAGSAPARGQPSDLVKIREAFHAPDSPTVLISAHRGLMGISTGCGEKFPENSLSGIARSIELGADIIEMDVRQTRDGHLILMHDRTVNRTTSGQGTVADLTLDQVRELRLRLRSKRWDVKGPLSEERVPTLEEALALCRGKCLVSLDKAWSLIPECQRMLEKTGTADQAVFLCYSSAAQARKNLAGRKAPPICVIIDVSEEDTHQDDWDLIEPYRDALRPAVYTVTFDTDDHSITRPETIRKIRRSGARVWGNTMWDQQSGGHSDARSLDDPQQGWGWMIDRGFNIIQTDEGEKLLNYLRSQNRHW